MLRIILKIAARYVVLPGLVMFGALILFRIAHVLGAWNEPQYSPPGNVSPADQLTAPITTSSLEQARGTFAAANIRIDDIGKWMTDIRQFKAFGGNSGIEPHLFFGFYYYNPPSNNPSLPPPPDPGFSGWTTIPINPGDPQFGLTTIPLPVTAKIDALALEATCGETVMWLFAPTPGNLTPLPPPYNANGAFSAPTATYIACYGGNNDADSQTVILPVTQATPAGIVEFKYRLVGTNTGNNTASAALRLMGVYYHHETETTAP